MGVVVRIVAHHPFYLILVPYIIPLEILFEEARKQCLKKDKQQGPGRYTNIVLQKVCPTDVSEHVAVAFDPVSSVVASVITAFIPTCSNHCAAVVPPEAAPIVGRTTAAIAMAETRSPANPTFTPIDTPPAAGAPRPAWESRERAPR